MFEQVLADNSIETQSYGVLDVYGLGINNQSSTNTMGNLDFAQLETITNQSVLPVNDTEMIGVAALPVVTIEASDKTAAETNQGQTVNKGQFTISRTGNLSKSLTVSYKIAGTATNGQDYNNLSGSVTIAAGKSTAKIIITPQNDQLVENQENVTLTLSKTSKYTLGTDKQATVNINDNDKPAPGATREWVNQSGTNQDDVFFGVATDTENNVYAAGYTSATDEGTADALITKYDTNGQELWSRQFGKETYQDDFFFSVYSEQLNDIAVDNDGNAYVIGIQKLDGIAFNNPVDPFDDDYFYDYEILVAKFDTNGNEIWTQTYGNSINDNGYGITVDNNGNVYIAGNYDSLFSNSAITARLDPDDGSMIWDQYYGSRSLDLASAITTDDNGAVYVTGLVQDRNLNQDIWTAKYTANGKLAWLTVTDADSNTEAGTDIEVDNNGNVYVTGVQNVGFNQYNGVLVKYDSKGVWQWTKSYGNANDDDYQDLAIDNQGNIYITGPKIINKGGETTYDSTLLKVNSNGKLIWEQAIRDNDGNVFSTDMTFDNNGDLLIAGLTNGTLQGPQLGNYDTWVAKYSV